MEVKETISLDFTKDELLTIVDWFNGYCSKYMGNNPDVISEKLTPNQKQLINRFLNASGELPMFTMPVLQKE